MFEILRYVTADGKDVFGEWLAAIRDARARARIAVRIDRLAIGRITKVGQTNHESKNQHFS
jgi:putative component of toxin-antitoxin plasmid stabilization module